MKKKFWINFGLVHLVIVAVSLGVYFFVLPPAEPVAEVLQPTETLEAEAEPPNDSEPTTASEPAAPSEPTTVEPAQNSLEIKLELEFESVEDLESVMLMSYNGSEDYNRDEMVSGGLLRLGGGSPVQSVGVPIGLGAGEFIHYRTRASMDTCYAFGIAEDSDNQTRMLNLDGCTNGEYNGALIFVRDHAGDTVYGQLPFFGAVPALADEWVDKIIWLNETGDRVYYLQTNTDDYSTLMAGSIELSDDWQFIHWDWGMLDGFLNRDENGYTSQYIDIDMIRVGKGSLLNYLENYPPAAYLTYQQDVAALMAEEPPPMPELHPEGWQEAVADTSDANTSGSDTGGEELNIEVDASGSFGVLTWPDPTGMLPYLVKLEDISRCNNCENSVYGVTLSPTGYSFMVAYGNPSGDKPGEDSRVTEWVDIYTDTVDQDEYLFMAQIYHYRIPAFAAGEAIQLINPSSAATYLLRIKENVVMMAHVDNAGKNARIANQILDGHFPLIPEEGLEIPGLVAEPSTELNAELFGEVVEQVGIGSFENGSVKLKAPVEKLEVAVFDPCSQTYLSYFWMDNPATGVDLWVMPEKPDDYYFANYQCDAWLIRMWVDGELVYEVPVGK